MSENCGCKIIWPDGVGSEPGIEYCPLHASAETLRDALKAASDCFHFRDEMNAAIHQTSVRLSPITIAVDAALAAAQGQTK